jgi:hypothetical protein
LRSVAASVVFLLAQLGWPATAGAAASSFDVGDQALVQIVLPEADLSIKTWDRNTVKVEGPDADAVLVTRGLSPVQSVVRIPALTVIEGETRADAVAATLQPEDFPIGVSAPGLHDAINIGPAAPANPQLPPRVTVTIPATTRKLFVRVTHGLLALNDYHGTSIIYTGNAAVTLTHVGGDAFVQANNAVVNMNDSNFNLLRARTNRAELIFERCHVRQIDATTLTGAIVYDNGTFEPGLAHFESDRGNIALGVNGNAQLVAHSDPGRVFSTFPGGHPEGITGEERAQVGTGGLVVSASTGSGNVYLYDGALAGRHSDQSAWRPVHQALNGKRAAERRAQAAARQPQTAPRPRGRF